MEESFLSSLIDTTGNVYLFGKKEESQKSIFFFGTTDTVKTSAVKYVEIYRGHELKPTHAIPLMRRNVTPDWFFPMILLVLVVITWLRLFYSKFFSQMVQAFMNSNLANQIVRDENIFVQRASVYLSIVFNVVAGLLLYQLSIRYGWRLGGIGTGFGRFLFFGIIVTAAYAIKFMALRISGWLFELERELATYMFNIFLINNVLGMALFPIICLIAYNETLSYSWFLVLPVILIGIAFLWRIFRGLQIGLGVGSFSPLYLFLYLCTLEIAPLVILLRIIV